MSVENVGPCGDCNCFLKGVRDYTTALETIEDNPANPNYRNFQERGGVTSIAVLDEEARTVSVGCTRPGIRGSLLDQAAATLSHLGKQIPVLGVYTDPN